MCIAFVKKKKQNEQISLDVIFFSFYSLFKWTNENIGKSDSSSTYLWNWKIKRKKSIWKVRFICIHSITIEFEEEKKKSESLEIEFVVEHFWAREKDAHQMFLRKLVEIVFLRSKLLGNAQIFYLTFEQWTFETNTKD